MKTFATQLLSLALALSSALAETNNTQTNNGKQVVITFDQAIAGLAENNPPLKGGIVADAIKMARVPTEVRVIVVRDMSSFVAQCHENGIVNVRAEDFAAATTAFKDKNVVVVNMPASLETKYAGNKAVVRNLAEDITSAVAIASKVKTAGPAARVYTAADKQLAETTARLAALPIKHDGPQGDYIQ